jgi:DNA-binding PadR family transcriptional regulator
MKKLTSTSYALLGLLAERPWSAYELAKYMKTSLVTVVWPRAVSRLYEEPKKLLEHGLATSEQQEVRGRLRTTYDITDLGREALEQWLNEPAAEILVEHESMLKLLSSNTKELDKIQSRIDEVEKQIQAGMGLVAKDTHNIAEQGFSMPGRALPSVLGLLYVHELAKGQQRWVERSREMLAQRNTNLRGSELESWAHEQYSALAQEIGDTFTPEEKN